ncbi:MAG: L-fuconolactonase [Candidatus Azotimanducaceae bacterium]|jgi:L-fuconolactonase
MYNDKWLAQVQEEIIEPDLKICDPHHHLWDYKNSRYLLDEILEDLGSGHNVVSTVFMECGSEYRAYGPESEKSIGETEFVAKIARSSEENSTTSKSDTKVCEAMVGYVDLELGRSVKDILEHHIEAGEGRFRGIRHATGWHADETIKNSHSNPPAHLMLDDAFREGFAALSELDLSFDAWFYHQQIPEFIDLARTFPETVIVLDHFGGPLGIGCYSGKLDDVFKEWQDLVAPLAELSNVSFKLGGLNMRVNGFQWHKNKMPPSSDEIVTRTARYYEHVIKLAGTERCMFESNFPVDKDSVAYHVLWNAFKKMSSSYSAKEKADLFYDTAAKVYRLG